MTRMRSRLASGSGSGRRICPRRTDISRLAMGASPLTGGPGLAHAGIDAGLPARCHISGSGQFCMKFEICCIGFSTGMLEAKR